MTAGIGHNQPQLSVEGLSPEDRKVLRRAIKEINDSMTRAAAEKDLQKEVIDNAFDQIGVDKKLIRAMAKIYFKANFKDVVDSNNMLEEFYEAVMHKTTD